MSGRWNTAHYAEIRLRQTPFMTFPEADAQHHRPDPAAFRALYEAIGVSRAELARRTGICERRVRYLHAGYKEIKGARTPVVMSYPEQALLELMAWAAHCARKRDRG